MRSLPLSRFEYVSVNFGEFSRNSMNWRMAHVNCPVNGSLPKGSGNVYKPSGGHPNQNPAQIRRTHHVNITRESFYIFTAVSPPARGRASHSYLILVSTLNMLGAYYLFSPATHRSITIPLSKFTDARIFGKISLRPPDHSDIVTVLNQQPLHTASLQKPASLAHSMMPSVHTSACLTTFTSLPAIFSSLVIVLVEDYVSLC
jgi:hypothetical protein